MENNLNARCQEAHVLRALLDGEQVTPMDALHRWGCFRLAARIYTIRQRGFPVLTTLCELEPGTRVAVYHLSREAREAWKKALEGGE